MKFYIRGEPAKVKSLFIQIKAELDKGLGWRKLMIASDFSQSGQKSVLEFNSRPAFLLRRYDTARIQLETLMLNLMIQECSGAVLEKTEP